MKTISLELSKKLAPYLKGIETEYIYNDMWWIEENKWTDEELNAFNNVYKTLTLEEAIDFFLHKWPSNLHLLLSLFEENLTMIIVCIFNKERKELKTIEKITGTKKEAIEQIITYLLENNLLPKD